MTPQNTIPALAGRSVLITGATGFIGRHLTRALGPETCEVTLLVRPESAAGAAAEAGNRARVVPAALEDAGTLRAAVAEARPDVIFNLGAVTDPSRDLSRAGQVLTRNLTATVALAQAAMDAGTARFVAAGSAEEYGTQQPPFREDMAPRPLSPYSASKAAMTHWLTMLHDSHGFPAVVVRPFLCYGPGQSPPKLVPSAIEAALAGRDFPMTSGTQRRELTFVGDLVAGLLAAATRPEAPGQVLNLGSGDERPVLDIVNAVYRIAAGGGRPLPGAVPDRPADMQRFAADTDRAARVLGWRAATPLDAGLARSIGWARDNPGRPVPLFGGPESGPAGRDMP